MMRTAGWYRYRPLGEVRMGRMVCAAADRPSVKAALRR
jgi:hypothetical protein